MRRLLKFLHSLAAASLTGAMAAVAVVMILAPGAFSGAGYVPMMVALAKVAAWVIEPSMVLTVITGLLAMAVNPAYQDVGWVWAKAATGVLILEGGLHIMSPIQEAATRGASALASAPDAAGVASLLTSEGNTLILLIAVSVANIALAVWRPRFPKIPF